MKSKFLLMFLLLCSSLTVAMHNPPKPSIFKVQDLAYSMIEPDNVYRRRPFLIRYVGNVVWFSTHPRLGIAGKTANFLIGINPIFFVCCYLEEIICGRQSVGTPEDGFSDLLI